MGRMRPPGLATKLKGLRDRLDPELLERMVGGPTERFCTRHDVETGPCLTCDDVAREVERIVVALKAKSRGGRIGVPRAGEPVRGAGAR